MIPVVSTETARNLDQFAIGSSDLRGLSYMQRAAFGVFTTVTKTMNPEEGEIAVLCGKGNNGGDAYLTARMLLDSGYSVTCYAAASVIELAATAAMAREEYCAMGGAIHDILSADDIRDLSRYELIVDGLLGTGITGDPRGLYAECIEAINNSDAFVISIDIPSGLNGDTGERGIPTVNADHTVVTGLPRPAHLFFPGIYSTGTVTIREIGYTETQKKQCLSPTEVSLFEQSDLKSLIPPRRPDGNKYTHGTVTVIAGSSGMSGAVTLASLSVVRSGAGMCYTIVPKSMILPLSTKLTEPVLIGASETEQGTIAHRIGSILHQIESKTKVKLIGPGLSRNDETAEMVRDTLRLTTSPIVLDGDGLNACIDNLDLFRGVPSLVITPHEGEWERLFGPLPKSPTERIAAVSEVAKTYRIVVVLKGMPTLVSDHNGNVTIIQAGNSGMATAGCGDVLSGIIASFVAQGASVYEAAIAGVALHGEAGNCAAEKVGEYSLMASDIVNSLGEAFLKLEE